MPLIRHLKHTDIDKKAWDECITRSTNGIIYAYSWYLDAVCSGWEALVEGNYDYILPLCVGKKFGIRYLYPPYFAQQLGVFSHESIAEKKIVDFLHAIPDNIRFIDMTLNSKNGIQESNGLKVNQLRTHILDLNKPYEELYEHYAENTRRNLKKAVKNRLTIHNASTIDQVLHIFRQGVGKNIHNLKAQHYERLYDLIHLCLQHKKGQIIGVHDQHEKLIAGVAFINSHNRFIYLLSAADETGKQTGATHYLIDTFIRKHANSPTILDFEGGNAPNLARFYKSFGAVEQHYPHIIQNRLPSLLKWIKK
jgi:hypothetical protein